MFRRTLRVGALTFLLACGELVNPNCTNRGCTEGLRVDLSGELPAEFSLRLHTQLAPGPWEIACTPDTCGHVLEFDGFLPEDLRIEVVAEDEVLFDEWFFPTYTRTYPNGPQCDDGCLHARIEVAL